MVKPSTALAALTPEYAPPSVSQLPDPLSFHVQVVTLLSAAVTQRNTTHEEIQRACDQLAEMVTHLKASERPFPLPSADPQKQR